MDDAQPQGSPDQGGVDRTLIREMLAMSPTLRIARLAKEARFVTLVDRAAESARRLGSPLTESRAEG